MVYLGLPVYNEGSRLKQTLAEILQNTDYNLIVVDDGSSDEGTCIMRELHQQYPERMELIIHHQNKGLGQALNSILCAFVKKAAQTDWLVIMDADGTHSYHQIPALLACGRELVIASRFIKGAVVKGLACHRNWGSWLLNRVLSLITRVPDSTCGYRLYSYNVIASLHRHYGDRMIVERNFVGTFELLYKLIKLCGKDVVGWIPLELDFSSRTSVSKMNIKRELLAYTKFLWKEAI